MLYTGLDLHRSFSYITTMNDKGKIVGQKKLPSNGEVVEFLKAFDETMEVAIEATPSWYWLYDWLEEEGFDVKLSHPLKTKAIAYARVKTDKVDSATLAHLLRSDLLPLSYVPEKPVRLNRELLRYRASLVKIQSGIKNKVHTILAKNNVNHEYSDLFSKEGMAFLNSLSVPENYKIALEGYLLVLETIRHEIKVVSRRIQQLAQEDRDAMLLMTVPGVGYYSALTIKSEIGDVRRFPSAKQLCSYAGLVPSTYASGNSCYHGHITKQGSRWLRWILIEAAIHAVKRPGPLRRFYQKVERKKGGKVAKVATARKLLEWMYHMMKDGKTFTEVEKLAELLSKGEPVNSSGLTGR
ncbi:MAG TPA: IS110 family transposase [Dehalococcoidia bacterium]|nr:IS110 family transposase [Dehalococcoidia bacterium]